MAPTWVGAGLAAGVDTYLRARAQYAREDEMDQVGALRKQQGAALEQQLQEKQDLAEAARMLAAPDAAASDVTLSAGVPEVAPGSTTVAGEVQQPSPNTMPGGIAPDATLGNQAQTTTATPGAPGMAPVVKRYKTEQDAMKTLGPDLYGRLASSQQGRELLKSQGVTPAVEIAQQQKRAVTMQEVRGLLKKSEEAARDGRAGDAVYLQAAAMERIAEAQDNPQMQMHYIEKATALRNSAQNDSADPKANEDYRKIWGAYETLKADPSTENKIAFQEVATSALSKRGQEFGQKALGAWATQHQNDQFNMELMGEMRRTGGNAPKAIANMLKNPTPAFMAALPMLLESKNRAIQKVFGLADDDTLLGNGVEVKMALMQVQAMGLDTSTPEGTRALITTYLSIVRRVNETKKDPNQNTALIKVFEPQLKLAMQDVDRAQEQLTKSRSQGPRAAKQAEQHLNDARERANDMVDAVNALLPKEHQLKHIGDVSNIDAAKPVVPVGDPEKVKIRYAELVKQGRDSLGRVPTTQELAKIKADAKSQLQKEGLVGPPGGAR